MLSADERTMTTGRLVTSRILTLMAWITSGVAARGGNLQLQSSAADVPFGDMAGGGEVQRRIGEAFSVDLAYAICPGMVGNGEARSAEACAELCDVDSGCDAWQYCPEDVGSCELPDGSRTPGDKLRCYVTTSTSSKGKCLPDLRMQWIGAATPSSGRVPLRTTPVATKKGFSGFVWYTDVAGDSHLSCDDAVALNREKGWYYTWTVRPSQGIYCIVSRIVTTPLFGLCEH